MSSCCGMAHQNLGIPVSVRADEPRNTSGVVSSPRIIQSIVVRCGRQASSQSHWQ